MILGGTAAKLLKIDLIGFRNVPLERGNIDRPPGSYNAVSQDLSCLRPRNCIYNFNTGAPKRSFELSYRLKLHVEGTLPRTF